MIVKPPPGRAPFFAAPKSDAGKRLVAIPSMILPDVLSDLDDLTVPGADALLFTSPTGKPLRHADFRRRVWLPALAASGLDVHFYDLRHTGNQLVAEAATSLRLVSPGICLCWLRVTLVSLSHVRRLRRSLISPSDRRYQAPLARF